jgi:hypothetical protein
LGSIIAEFALQLHDDGTVTCFGVQLPAGSGGVEAAPAVAGDSDPWAGIDASPTQPVSGIQQPNQGQQYAVAANAGAQQWQPPTQQWAQQSPQQYAQTQTQGPSCQHGPLKAIPGGYSQAKQKAYGPFWACQAPRGQQCKLDPKTLPPVPA